MTTTTTTTKTRAQLKAEQLWNGWFSFCSLGVHPESNRQLPAECVADCSGPGAKDEPVAAWVDRLGFDGPSWLFRQHLERYGCWDAGELADHRANRERVLWMWANDVWEEPDAYAYLYLS